MTQRDHQQVRLDEEEQTSGPEPGERGTTPMTGTTPSETAANIPGGDLYPASPGGDTWDQADDTESSERATGS